MWRPVRGKKVAKRLRIRKKFRGQEMPKPSYRRRSPADRHVVDRLVIGKHQRHARDGRRWGGEFSPSGARSRTGCGLAEDHGVNIATA